MKYLEYKDFVRLKEMKAKGYSQRRTRIVLGVTEYAVRKAWDLDEETYFSVDKPTRSKMEEHREFVNELLTNYPQIKNATIYDRLKESFPNIKIKLSGFNKWMQQFRIINGYLQDKRYYSKVPETSPGAEAQVDMGQMFLRSVSKTRVKVYFFAMVLSYSRMKYIYFTTRPFTSRLFCYAHERAFEYFGGRPDLLMYDQDRVLCVSENAGNVIYTREFDTYRSEVGFKVYLCKKADPNTKGKVENVIKFVKYNFLDSRMYSGIDNLNAECLKWLDRTGNENVHTVTRQAPREMFLEEQKHLIKHKTQNISLYPQKIVSATNVSTIVYNKSIYDLPLGRFQKGDRLRTEELDNELLIYDPMTEELVARHRLSTEAGKVVKLKTKEPETHLVYVKQTKNMYGNHKTATRYIEYVVQSKPRYVLEQMALLKKMVQEYDRQDVLQAMSNCMKRQAYCATEVLTELTAKMGVAKTKKLMPSRSEKSYERKAELLAKYKDLD